MVCVRVCMSSVGGPSLSLCLPVSACVAVSPPSLPCVRGGGGDDEAYTRLQQSPFNTPKFNQQSTRIVYSSYE